MTRDRVDVLLRSYRETKARCDYLQSQLSILETALRENEASMVSDQVSMSQAMTGMPHRTSVGDPVGNLALDLAMGNVTVFVKQIQEELEGIRRELRQKESVLRFVENWLSSLSEREKEVVKLKAMDQYSWADIVRTMKKEQLGEMSKHTAQRLYDKAMEKIYATAA